MPGRSDLTHEAGGEFDHLALLADSGLSRRGLLARFFGLALASLLPPWLPGRQILKGLGMPGAQVSESAEKGCRQQARQECSSPLEKTSGSVLQRLKWTPTCEFPVANGVTAKSNGCGPLGGVKKFGMRWKHLVPDDVLLARFTEACNAHDCCYGTCGESRELCDKRAHKSFIDACDRHLAETTSDVGMVIGAAALSYCYDIADIYYRGIASGGEDAFNESQEEVCDCCADSGPCGGRTCPEGWKCCGSNGGPGNFRPSCYDPAVFVCCDLKEPQFCPIFSSPGAPPGVIYCLQQNGPPFGGSCGGGPVDNETCAEWEEKNPGLQCSGPFHYG